MLIDLTHIFTSQYAKYGLFEARVEDNVQNDVVGGAEGGKGEEEEVGESSCILAGVIPCSFLQ